MEAAEAEVAVDTEMPFADYVKLLFRHAELFSRVQTAAMHAEVATRVALKAGEAFGNKQFDVAFLMSARCVHIIDKAQLLKKKHELEHVPTAPQVSDVRAVLRECMDRMELLQHDPSKLQLLHQRLMEKVRRESAARQEMIKMQLQQEQVNEEEQLREEHEQRRQMTIAKHLLPQSTGEGFLPPSSIIEQETFREQQKKVLLEAEQHRLNLLSARLAGRDATPTKPLTPMGPAADLLRQNQITAIPSAASVEHVPQSPVAHPNAASTIVTSVVPTHPSIQPQSSSRLTLKAPTTQELTSRLKMWDYNTSIFCQPRRGMVNLGNTCYLNSVCQCLEQTLLARYFRSDEYIASIVNRYEGGGKIANTFSYVARELSANDVLFPVSPSPFKLAMGRAYEAFSTNSQQDANEFLRCLLDGIHEDLNENSGTRAPLVEIENTKGTDEEIARQYWSEYTKRNRSIVVNLFAFQERSVLECPQCRRCTRSFSASMGVEVPIPILNRPVSVEDCLAQYCAEEILDAESLYQCDGCKKSVRASKQMSFFSLPEILVISIKRFRSYGNFSDKVSTPVAFQQTLDMSPFLSTSNQHSRFQLVGVVNHQGNIHGGHYTADARGIVDGQWCAFSDEVHKPAQRPDFKLAYLLFYAKMTS